MKKTWISVFVLFTLVFSTLAIFPDVCCSAVSEHSYTINSIKIKSQSGAEIDEIPDESFTLEALASVRDNAEDAQYFIFALYGEEEDLIAVRFANDFDIQNDTFTFSAVFPRLREKVVYVKAFIWDANLKPLSEPGILSFKTQVSPVTGVTLTQSGVYIKMTLKQPADKTGIVSYEALIYNKNNPSEAIHRSITLDSATAYYRMDSFDTFTFGHQLDTIIVTSNGGEGFESATWTADFTVAFSNKNVTITDAWVVSADEIDVSVVGLEKGFVGTIFVREDDSPIEDNSFYSSIVPPFQYSGGLSNWSDEDKAALENGDVSVYITGAYIKRMEETDGNWNVEFERIKSPKVSVRCDVDLVP